MDLQTKLQELKSMHDQGLITNEVYVDQQKALLSQGLSAESVSPVSTSTKTAPSTPASTSSWKWLVVLVLIVVLILGGIWFASKFGSRETRDAMNQLASQTGIGVQVIPWSEGAETVARKFLELNEGTVANAIQAICHPTGKEPQLTKTSIAKLDDRIVVQLTVSWKGGFIGTPYQTTVTWEIGKAGHIAAKILADSAPFDVSRSSKETLDDYFRTKMYPAFYSGISGSNP